MTDRIDLGLKDDKDAASCSCCSTTARTDAEVPELSSAVTQDVLVAGMTCSHCVTSVTEELSGIEGVERVVVDLHAGGSSRVTIHSAAPIDLTVVKTAVEEAGYSLPVAR